VIDIGTGPPLVVIPGIQGRWEWMAPAIEALASRQRVISFSLNGPARGGDDVFAAWVRAVDRLLDDRGLSTAAVVGVSFGGLVAIRYAATRPGRVASLVLVSTPSPRWRLDPRSAAYARRPLLSTPLFALRGVRRLAPEIVAARPTWPARLRLAVTYGARVVRFPLSPPSMARWAAAWMAEDLTEDCARVTAPTLVVTGDAALDRVVPVSSTLELLALIPHAGHTAFPGTGHVGLITHPRRFADIVTSMTLRPQAPQAHVHAG
jgi:pimeloyl-ACP methyl ester carboxylesterase